MSKKNCRNFMCQRNLPWLSLKNTERSVLQNEGEKYVDLGKYSRRAYSKHSVIYFLFFFFEFLLSCCEIMLTTDHRDLLLVMVGLTLAPKFTIQKITLADYFLNEKGGKVRRYSYFPVNCWKVLEWVLWMGVGVNSQNEV